MGATSLRRHLTTNFKPGRASQKKMGRNPAWCADNQESRITSHVLVHQLERARALRHQRAIGPPQLALSEDERAARTLCPAFAQYHIVRGSEKIGLELDGGGPNAGGVQRARGTAQSDIEQGH